MRASRNISIRAVRESNRQEYLDRRQQASEKIEARLVRDHDTLFSWASQPGKPEKTGK